MSNGTGGSSIHDLEPIETGGVEARQGFGLQDHVAAGFCIQMMRDNRLAQVWCETQDDITLIWANNSIESVEFVQVKGNEPDQLWSTSMLCQREQKIKKANRLGTSILERSLAYDRCLEPCCFRIVTSRPVNTELRVLTFPLASKARANAKDELIALADSVAKTVGDYRSPNGRCCRDWVASATWQETHSSDVAKRANLIELMKIAKGWGSILLFDQVESIYDRLLFKVNQAALIRHTADLAAKKLLRQALIDWVKGEIARLEYPVAPGTGTTLRNKMMDAGIKDDIIDNAIEMRLQYRIDVLTPQYQESGSRRVIEQSVREHLQHLLVKFDAGQVANSGAEFHAACLDRLAEISETISTPQKPSRGFLFGCMYDIADRCRHRFRRSAG